MKSTREKEIPTPEHVEYANRVLGDATIVRLSFTDQKKKLEVSDGGLVVGLRHSLGWILDRFEWMDGHHLSSV